MKREAAVQNEINYSQGKHGIAVVDKAFALVYGELKSL